LRFRPASVAAALTLPTGAKASSVMPYSAAASALKAMAARFISVCCRSASAAPV
jgi:hypothetical protein